jgi:hypothetical protein
MYAVNFSAGYRTNRERYARDRGGNPVASRAGTVVYLVCRRSGVCAEPSYVSCRVPLFSRFRWYFYSRRDSLRTSDRWIDRIGLNIR